MAQSRMPDHHSGKMRSMQNHFSILTEPQNITRHVKTKIMKTHVFVNQSWEQQHPSNFVALQDRFRAWVSQTTRKSRFQSCPSVFCLMVKHCWILSFLSMPFSSVFTSPECTCKNLAHSSLHNIWSVHFLSDRWSSQHVVLWTAILFLLIQASATWPRPFMTASMHKRFHKWHSCDNPTSNTQWD